MKPIVVMSVWAASVAGGVAWHLESEGGLRLAVFGAVLVFASTAALVLLERCTRRPVSHGLQLAAFQAMRTVLALVVLSLWINASVAA